jgi:small subunit ribosomal protein S21
MLIIKVEEKETIEKSLKRYKRKFEKVKIVRELRDRKHFKKKSIKNREKLNKAIYIQQKFGDGIQ